MQSICGSKNGRKSREDVANTLVKIEEKATGNIEHKFEKAKDELATKEILS